MLENESLMTLKKEVLQLAELVATQDSTWTGVSLKVSKHLSSIFQKPEPEMLILLKKTLTLEKKKKHKQQLDKLVAACRAKVELELKIQNKKHKNDFVKLEELQSVKFNAPANLKEVLKPL